MKLVAFAASSSSKSINRKLVTYAANLLQGYETELLDINDYELPLFSEDREAELGQPLLAQQFFAKIGSADALMISFAEHNGSYTAAYKSLFDWVSRIDQKVFQNKPMVLLSASPGPGGASSVLTTAVNSAPYFAGDVKASVSVPHFYENFDLENNTVKNTAIRDEIMAAVGSLEALPLSV